MKKKEYLMPAMNVHTFNIRQQVLVDSVRTTGLNNDDLVLDDDDGNITEEAVGRSFDLLWDDEAL